VAVVAFEMRLGGAGQRGKKGGDRRGHVRVEAGEGGEMEARRARMVPLSSNRGGQRGTGDAA
jgi:hypothetical protein